MGAKQKPEWDSVDAEAAASDASLRDHTNEDPHGDGDLKNDPFGNEENKEVKYRTMKWW
jgi:hypothetical protein